MLVYQQFFYLLIGLGILVGLPAFWLFARGMWPKTVEHASEVASRSVILNFLCGLPMVALVIVMLTQAGKIRAVGGGIAVTVGVVALLWGLIGVAGLASHIGSRLWPACKDDDAWRGMLRGSLVVAGSLTIPFIGWFLLPLVLIAVGVGIRVRMWFVHGPLPLPLPQTQAQMQLESQPGAVSPAMPQPTV
jgi:hypothetical protein